MMGSVRIRFMFQKAFGFLSPCPFTHSLTTWLPKMGCFQLKAVFSQGLSPARGFQLFPARGCFQSAKPFLYLRLAAGLALWTSAAAACPDIRLRQVQPSRSKEPVRDPALSARDRKGPILRLPVRASLPSVSLLGPSVWTCVSKTYGAPTRCTQIKFRNCWLTELFVFRGNVGVLQTCIWTVWAPHEIKPIKFRNFWLKGGKAPYKLQES